MLTVDPQILDEVTSRLALMLQGRNAPVLELGEEVPDNEVRQVVGFLNRLIDEYNVSSDYMFALARGELEYEPPKGHLRVIHAFKTLHSHLRHLTWQTQQIARGDFNQRVDFMGDFSEAFNSMTLQLKQAFEEIEAKNRELSQAYEIIREERDKAERLLLNTLPLRVVQELQATGKTEPRTFDAVSVMFVDVVDFTRISSHLAPQTVIAELNDIYSHFDEIVERHRCERIKTIGDAYLAVCGMDHGEPEHAQRITRSAIDIIEYLTERNRGAEIEWRVRAGINSGSVVGGVVGIKKYIYDVFGDTINTASRMERLSTSMRINLSESTYDLVKHEIPCVGRAPCEVKGKGVMQMFFVEPNGQPPAGATT